MLTEYTADKSWRLNPTCFSDWIRLLRLHAWVMRFIRYTIVQTYKRFTGTLSAEEIHEAELFIIKNAQRDIFGDEYKALVQH